MPVEKLIEHIAASHRGPQQLYRPTWRRATGRPAPPATSFTHGDTHMIAEAILDDKHPTTALNVMLGEAHLAELNGHNRDEHRADYYLDYARMVRLACSLAKFTLDLEVAARPRKPGQTDKPVDVRNLKETVDIVSYINSYVPLVKKGSYFQAPCPFHDDRSPSFTVWPDGHWKCFGCGKGGSVIDFVMEWRRCDFKTALQIITGGI
jgi:hypothetical protein